MQRRMVVILSLVFLLPLCGSKSLGNRQQAVELNLAALAETDGFSVFNRTLIRFEDGPRKGVRLSEASGDGVAFLKGIEFTNGTLEFEVRGKDVQQQSFVGIAFHGLDDKTYDAIYFRPFNFKSQDPARRLRAVQYIAHPAFPWPKLREEHPGQYEKPVSPAPDPNGWFQVRVVVSHPKVSVYVNNAQEPSLVIDQLSDRQKGLVGLWVGNTSAGDFANLKIIPR